VTREIFGSLFNTTLLLVYGWRLWKIWGEMAGFDARVGSRRELAKADQMIQMNSNYFM